MTVPSFQLLDDLKARTEQVLQAVQAFQDLSEDQLNWRASATSWSILECLEHLNLYGNFYIPEIRRRIAAAEKTTRLTTFQSGLLGNYMANMMLPKEKGGKMKTFKSKNPLGSSLTVEVLYRCEKQQELILDLLKKARQVDPTKVKTSISLSPLLKLRLGDTFRVVIYHNQRHIAQAQRVLAQQEEKVQNPA